MRNRGKKSTANFPKFDIDKVNRVIPIILDFIYRETEDGLSVTDELSEEESDKIENILDGKSGTNRNIFAESFEFIDEATKPKEYKDLSEDFEIQVFRGGQVGENERTESARLVAELCKNSKSFCIRGVGMAKQYLQSGDLWIMTRYGTNVKTRNRELVPDMAIYIQTIGGYHVNEIHGNEEFQDLHPRNALWIKSILKDFWEIEQIKNEDEKIKALIQRKNRKYDELEHALYYHFYNHGVQENEDEIKKLDNVLRLGDIKDKIAESKLVHKRLLSIEDLSFIGEMYENRSFRTFEEVTSNFQKHSGLNILKDEYDVFCHELWQEYLKKNPE